MREYARTVDDYIELLPAVAIRTFCNQDNEQRISALARIVPAAYIRYFGFEWPLRDGDGVDFALSVTEDGLAWIHERAPWPNVRSFLHAARSCEYDRGNVWFEWDAASRGASLEPSVYLTFDDFCSRSPSRRAQLYELADEHAEAVARCLSAMPATVDRLHAGCMLGRGQHAVRLGIQLLSLRELCDFANEARLPIGAGVLETLLQPFADLCDGISIQVDCCRQDVTPVGWELIFSGEPVSRQPENEPRWHALFARLIKLNYAQEERVSTLLAWPSVREFRLPAVERMMAELESRAGFRALHGSFVTGLQHVKLAISDAETVHAKAYFGAAFFDA